MLASKGKKSGAANVKTKRVLSFAIINEEG